MTAERVVCLAFDSPGNSFLRAGLEQGKLPTLASLLDRGRSVALVDTQELTTPASWPTLIRGCGLADHRLGNDRLPLPGEYRIGDVEPERARRPPFWRYISDAGLPCVVLSAYSAQLLDDFSGAQVLGWGSHDPFDGKLRRERSDRPGLIAELDRLVGGRTLHFGQTPPRTPGRVRAYVKAMIRGCAQQAQALGRMLELCEWRFVWASFGECHQAGHLLWHLADPAHPDHDPRLDADLRDGLARIYEATDRALGAVIERLPDETAVLVVSPYDMAPNHHLDEVLSHVLERAGWLVRAPARSIGPRVRALRAGRRVVHAVVPTSIRPALGRLAGRDRLLAELDEGAIDWGATRVMRIPSDGSAAVRLNLAGRDPAGTVRPGSDAERLLEDVTARLYELRDADTDLPVVARVARYEELSDDVEPLSGDADLFIQWAHAKRPRAVRSERLGEIPVPARRSNRSVHRVPGFVVAAGPGIEHASERSFPGESQARLADVGATVLALLDVPLPPEISGRPIAALAPADAAAGA